MWLLLLLLSGVAGLAVLRFLLLLSRQQAVPSKPRRSSCRTLIVLGSGGHTAEMLRLLGGLSLDRYSPRVYVAAESDKMSVEKATAFDPAAEVLTIPRARKVLQSYFSSLFTTAAAIAHALPLVWRARPDLMLCNGPGTCVPLCLSAYLFTFLGLRSVRVVYVESFCRVDHLSLSGLLLYWIVDRVVVQWPQLKTRYPRTHYVGRLI